MATSLQRGCYDRIQSVWFVDSNGLEQRLRGPWELSKRNVVQCLEHWKFEHQTGKLIFVFILYSSFFLYFIQSEPDIKFSRHKSSFRQIMGDDSKNISLAIVHTGTFWGFVTSSWQISDQEVCMQRKLQHWGLHNTFDCLHYKQNNNKKINIIIKAVCSSVEPCGFLRMFNWSKLSYFRAAYVLKSAILLFFLISTQVKLSLYNDTEVKVELVFNGTDSDILSWFAKESLVSSPWSDLTVTATTNQFSIGGDVRRSVNRYKQHFGRTFFWNVVSKFVMLVGWKANAN